MIAVIIDIDSVIKDGTFIVELDGNPCKQINIEDIDAICELHRRKIYIGAVTAEKNDISEWIKARLPWDVFYDASSDKGKVLDEIRQKGYEYVVYVGDGRIESSAFVHADFIIGIRDTIGEKQVHANHILKSETWTGVLWELIALGDRGFSCCHSNCKWYSILEEHYRLVGKMIEDLEYQKATDASAQLICEALLNNRRVVIFGNGGSAADAQHIATEFMARFQKERRALDMEALTVNTSLLTAIGNDYSYDDVFARQIEGMTQEGDVAIGISTSGAARNVRKALDRAKCKNVKTILLTGNQVDCTGYDVTLKVCSDNTARIQEIHIMTGHFWADYVETQLYEIDNSIGNC